MDFTRLAEFIDFLPTWRIPGCDIAVYYKHEPVFRHSAGYADVKTKTPITPDNLYNQYSTSKVVTVTGALTLFERGKFLMDDPLYEYLPEFREMKIERVIDGKRELVPATKPIKIRDLFTMSAGFNYDVSSPSVRALREKTGGVFTTRQFAEAISREPLGFEPGEHWRYSLCHDVLGALIEVLSGKSFGEYLAENVFEPVGMKDTGFKVTDENRGRIASLYRWIDAKSAADEIDKTENAYRASPLLESGGAGLVSSVDDYILFCETLCNRGLTRSGERILSSATVDLMRENHLDERRMKDFNWSQMVGYGYGLGVRTMISRPAGGALSPCGEFGWGGAAGAYVMIDPDREVAAYYVQHMLNNQEPFVHPRLRNLIYASLD